MRKDSAATPRVAMATALLLLAIGAPQTLPSPLERKTEKAQLSLDSVSSQGPLIPNASLVKARVLKYSVWDPALLNPASPEAFYSLVLNVCASENVEQEANLVKADEQIEVFSKVPLSPKLFGRIIQAGIRALGDERGQRFWIRDIKVLESDESCARKSKKEPQAPIRR